MKNIVKIIVKHACNESTTIIIIFRLSLSEITPAKGVMMSNGIRLIKLAKDNINGLFVTSVIHTNMTKKTTNDPNNENNCPNQKFI
jgi:hypothetical protein